VFRQSHFAVAENTDDRFNYCGWKSSDPYGVARFDLSGLLLGQTVFQFEEPIMRCRVTESTWKPSIGLDGRLIPPPGVKDGPSVHFF